MNVCRSHKNMASKQQVLKQKIEQYFHRLTQGCKRKDCTNPNCASNPSHEKLPVNEAAVKAIELLRQKAEICWTSTENFDQSLPCTSASSNIEQTAENVMDASGFWSPSARKTISQACRNIVPDAYSSEVREKKKIDKDQGRVEKDMPDRVFEVQGIKYLTEDIIDQLLQQCEEEDSRMIDQRQQDSGRDPYLPLCHHIAEVFSSLEGITKSFLKLKPEKAEKELEKKQHHQPSPTLESMKINPFGTPHCSAPMIDNNHDFALSSSLASSLSDEGSSDFAAQDPSGFSRLRSIKNRHSYRKEVEITKREVTVFTPTVDIESVRRVYEKLQRIEKTERVLVSSLELLSLDVALHLNAMKQLGKSTVNLNGFVTIMENPLLHSPEYLEAALPGFCTAISELPIEAIAKLAEWWSGYSAVRLRKMVQCLQQLLTYKVLQAQLSAENENEQLDNLHSNDVIASTVKCLKILYYASLLGGKIDKDMDRRVGVKAVSTDLDAMAAAVGLEEEGLGGFERDIWKDPLSELLGISDRDVIDPLIPAREFQNELLNETFSIYSDFTNFMIDNRAKSDQFTFMQYPFVLNTVSKSAYFFYDNKIQMLSGRRMMVLQSILHRSPISPYLRLKIRRDHVIADSLVRLEMISNENPQDLRKQLYVEFEDEQGVDEGGLSKEFFQLVVEKIFNPDYGMFTYNDDMHVFWFNAHSLENKAEFKLIGIVLGLAIYNSCILNIKFPIAVYKKLLGKRARFDDLQQSHPNLYRGLKQLLEYDGNVQEDMMATFSAEYHDMFGIAKKHQLRPNGDNIPVTEENRCEYVDLYADWLLNESISEQFNAFRYGFDLVVAKSPIKYLFRIDELEVLISGSQEYDFNSLQSTAEYDGGFEKESQTVQDFWSVVHEMTDEDKKKLLQFTTGSDRAPVGGLSQLKLACPKADFVIVQVIARNGPDSDRLPAAHTCFNVILLPDYKNRDKLKERLYKALTHAKGFGML